MNDFLIEIQSEKTFDISKDILIRLHEVSDEYADGYVDALNMAYSNKFVHCNKVPVKISEDTYRFAKSQDPTKEWDVIKRKKQ